MNERFARTIRVLTLIAVGGFAGANARHALGESAVGLSPLPATLVANVVGSLVLGFVVYERRYLGAFSEPLRVALGTGFLSSFTTYSTFAVLATETAIRPSIGPATMGLALGFVIANYGLALVGVVCGRTLARRAAGGPT